MAFEAEGGAAAALAGGEGAAAEEQAGAGAGGGDAAAGAASEAGAGGELADWLKGYSATPGEGEEVSNLDYLKGKGFKDPDAVVKALRTFEAKARGGAVPKPGEGASAEELAAWHKQIGVPENAEGYSIEVDLPQGVDMDTEVLAAMREVAFKGGVPAEGFKAMAEGLIAYQLAQHDAEVKRQDDLASAKYAEWGSNKDANMALAQRGIKAFGLDGKDVAAIQKGLGSDRMLDLALKLGKIGGEDLLAGTGGGQFGMGLAEAQAEIDRIVKDPELAAKVRTDAGMKAKWERLNATVAFHKDRERRGLS